MHGFFQYFCCVFGVFIVLKPFCFKILGLFFVVFGFLLFYLLKMFLYIHQGTCRDRREAMDEDACRTSVVSPCARWE